MSILDPSSSSGHVLSPRQRCSCGSEGSKLGSAFHACWVIWRRAHCPHQHSRGSLGWHSTGQLCSWSPGVHPGQSMDAGKDFPLVLSISLMVMFGSAKPSTWQGFRGEPGTRVKIWQCQVRSGALWRAVMGRLTPRPHPPARRDNWNGSAAIQLGKGSTQSPTAGFELGKPETQTEGS